MEIFALSGSLRAGSSNTTLLHALRLLAPPDTTVTIYEGLGDLPHFNPDLDSDPAPASVADLRSRLGEADALVICSPEYAHGVPGVLKNALDWLVSSGETDGLPTAQINATPFASFAQTALTEILRTMSAQIVGGGAVVLPTPVRNRDAAALATDPIIAPMLRGVLAHLTAAERTAALSSLPSSQTAEAAASPPR